MGPYFWTIVVGLVSAVVGTTGAAAWFKLGPERRQTTVETAHSLLKDSEAARGVLADELSQAKMRNMELHQAEEDLRRQLETERIARMFDQRNSDRQSRLAWMARRQAHLARKTLGNYEVHIEFLLDELRKAHIPITPIMRPQRIKAAFQEEQEKLEKMEAAVTEEIASEIPDAP